MKTIDLPYFGLVEIDPSQEEQQYEFEIPMGDSWVELNLIYQNPDTTFTDLGIIKNFLADFPAYALASKNALLEDYAKTGISREYIELHVDAFTSEGKEMLLETLAQDFDNLNDYFLSILELSFVYMFPDTDDEFIKMNFNVSDEISDAFLFVRYDKKMVIQEIGIEY